MPSPMIAAPFCLHKSTIITLPFRTCRKQKKNYKAYILQILFQINTEAFMWLIICTITSAAATKPMLTGFLQTMLLEQIIAKLDKIIAQQEEIILKPALCSLQSRMPCIALVEKAALKSR